jgi:hypothetical protein
MNVQEMLINWRNIINTEKSNAQSEKRDSVINIDFEQLLVIAETQNACIKAMRKGKSAQELETWLVEPNKFLNDKSPLEMIDTGEVHKVYDII